MLRSVSVGSVVLMFLVGCSGGSDLEPANSNGSSNGSSASAGKQEESAPDAKTTALDVADATTVIVGSGYCGGAPGTCNGQESYEITFATSTLEKRSCASGDSKRVLDASQMKTLRDSLAQVRVSSAPFANNQDGHMFGLTVTTSSGRKDYSPEPSCNHSSFEKIEGFDQLWTTVRSL